jgi:hypothetical protein
VISASGTARIIQTMRRRMVKMLRQFQENLWLI